MQFKHPEILYALFALLIPILIHLFQLQRFTKTPFTNVKFLKEIELQTRKSSRLKKWLVLLARLLLFASLIIAFAQPFFSQNKSSKEWLTTIYLDNSISMSAKGNRGELLKRAVQDIAENLPEKGKYNLILNDKIQIDLPRKAIIEKFKTVVYSPVDKSFKTVLLQAKDIISSNVNTNHKLIVVSDFQNNTNGNIDVKSVLSTFKHNIDIVQLTPVIGYNVSIDSVFVKENNIDNTLLDIKLKNQGEGVRSVSLRALQNDIVLAKNVIELNPNTSKTISLRIPTKVANLTLKIDGDDSFIFDNVSYVSFPKQNKVNVLVIGKSNSFVEKIYTDTEFNLNVRDLNQISYELIDKQQLIVINTWQQIPKSLEDKLLIFVKEGGSLAIIPSQKSTINGFNSFFNKLKIGQISAKHTDSLQVTKIHFSHPLIKNVFDKKVTNFQYPKVNTYFEGIFNNQQPILSFENERPFISQITKGKGSIFWVASPLDSKTSNFIKSPLVVPIFYNIGKYSTLPTQLSYRLGRNNEIIVNQKLEKDEVVHVKQLDNDFIPRQEIQFDKVLLYTDKQPSKSGFYSINYKNRTIQTLAYNNPKKESNYSYYNVKSVTNSNIKHKESVKDSLMTLSSEQSLQSYFKWFVLLALFFVLIEILLLKYL